MSKTTGSFFYEDWKCGFRFPEHPHLLLLIVEIRLCESENRCVCRSSGYLWCVWSPTIVLAACVHKQNNVRNKNLNKITDLHLMTCSGHKTCFNLRQSQDTCLQHIYDKHKTCADFWIHGAFYTVWAYFSYLKEFMLLNTFHFRFQIIFCCHLKKPLYTISCIVVGFPIQTCGE